MTVFGSGFADDLKNMIELKVATNHSEGTYTEAAKTFDDFCAGNCPKATVLNEGIVFSIVKECIASGSGKKAHSMISFLHTFAVYQKAMGMDPYIPSEKMFSGKSMFLPYILSDDELTALFNALDKMKYTVPFHGILCSTYFRLAYTCGLRPSEARKLKCIDVDMVTGEIRIINSKWNKSRTIIMSDDMLSLLRKYKIYRDNIYPESEYLFPAPNGAPQTSNRMQGWFKRAFAASQPDIPKELLPAVRVYDLRHRFATAALNRWLDSGQDINSRLPYLQTYMGHKELGYTAYYIHLLPENVAKSAGVDWKKLNAIVPEVEAWEE